jgi:hypothetical protein
MVSPLKVYIPVLNNSMSIIVTAYPKLWMLAKAQSMPLRLFRCYFGVSSTIISLVLPWEKLLPI